MTMGELRQRWLHLPTTDSHTLLGGHRPFVMAPHPDDESLGCAGLLVQCARANLEPQVAILTDGSRSHPGSITHPPKILAALRRSEAETALGVLGVSQSALHWLGIEDTRLRATGPAGAATLDRLATLFTETGCGVILAPWRGDPHCDHESAAALAALLSHRLQVPCLTFPVWGWTLPAAAIVPEDRRGFRLSITSELEQKQRAIRAHATQYSKVIIDSPNGFTLPPDLLEIFARPYETYLLT